MSNDQTIAEAILSRAVGRRVRAGDILFPEADLVVVQDWYAANAVQILQRFGVERLHAPEKVLFVTDHEPLAVSPEAAKRQAAVREAVRRLGVGRFFDVGRGGHGHIFPVEMGLVHPGMFVAAYDTHVPNYGAIGALGIPLLTEIVDVLALGSVWIQVPESVRVELRGRLRPGVSVRDFAQRLIADLDPDVVDYTVVEFGGPGLLDLPFDARFTLCNTPIEIGAKSAVVDVDRVTEDYCRERGIDLSGAVRAGPQAAYRLVAEYDLDQVVPQVALPPLPDKVVPITEVAGVPVQHAFVGSCASGSLSDLRMAAQVLKARTVNAGVRMFVTPGSHEIMAQAAREGLLEIFARAGAIVTAPGCGPCAGGRIAPLAPGETSINTGTRNDQGRLGPADASIYLASPLSVAAAAVAGKIVDPRDLLRGE